MNVNNHGVNGTSSAEASSSNTSPFSQHDQNDHILQDDHQLDTSPFADLSTNSALGIDASEYPTSYIYANPRTNPLSFKRRQAQIKPLSRFISHLYSTPKGNARQQRPTAIQTPPPNNYDIPTELEDDEIQDFSEQGYDKETLEDWGAEGGVGARKYDDLTAIGTHVQDLY
jgi:hypothetical protein